MNNKFSTTFFFALLITLAIGCSPKQENVIDETGAGEARLIWLETPAAPGSGEPNLFSDENGNVVLSWVEESEGGYKFRFSRLTNSKWASAQEIASGADWFVNWADFPSVATRNDGGMAAHYLAKNGEGTFAYGVNMTFSSNNGIDWSDPVIPHETESETEHGFVSLLPFEDGYFATWLDGRNTGGGHEHGGGPMTIRAAFIDAQGGVKDEFELDDMTCDCCQTSAAITENGPIVAYRDRSQEEIRDMSIVRWTKDGWTEPRTIYADNWNIAGCPVNGPVLAAWESNVAVAWFTQPEGKANVKLAMSTDNGATFLDPVHVDLGNPIGRVDLEIVEDGSIFVSWMESEGEMAKLMLAQYSADGQLQDQTVIADLSSGRSSGFPRMTRSGGYLYFALRDVLGEEAIIKTAKLKI